MAYPSVVPELLNALVEASGVALPDIAVTLGTGVTEYAGDYLMIGVDDPDGPEWARSASGTRDWDTIGGVDIEEEGDIACAALSWNGNGDQDAALVAAYAIAEKVADLCRANPTLSLPRLMWVLYGGQWDLLQIQSEDGALARFEFQLHFKALV